MKPQKFTTEDTEKKNFRFFKSSANSVVASSPKEYPCSKVKGRHKKTNTSESTERGREATFS